MDIASKSWFLMLFTFEGYLKKEELQALTEIGELIDHIKYEKHNVNKKTICK